MGMKPTRLQFKLLLEEKHDTCLCSALLDLNTNENYSNDEFYK